MTHEEQLKNRSYKRWIRGCLGFKYLGEGLVDTVEPVLRNQHKSYTEKLTHSECDKCSINTLLPNHAKVNKCTKGRMKCFCSMNTKSRTFCPNAFCSSVYDDIVDDHRHQDPNWLNTDITKWGNSYLEVAKCFISSKGYKDKLQIQDVDCSGLLNIIINDMAFESNLTKAAAASPFNPLSSFIEAREHRNSLFHCPNMEITEDQLVDMIDNMIVLLHLPGIISNGATALAVQKLQRLKDDEIFISLRDEIEIRQETIQKLELKQKEAIDEIEQSKQELRDRITDLNERCDTRIAALTEGQKKTDENLGNIKKDLNESCANLMDIWKGFEQKQTEIELTITRLQNALERLSTRSDENDLKQKALEKQISELIAEIPKLLEKHLITKLKNEHAASTMEDLAQRHHGKLEYLQRKKDMQNKFCSHYKKCLSTIPVSPVQKTISAAVDEVFVDLAICEGLNEKQNQEEEEQVLLYKDILFKSNRLCQNVYLQGRAGMGKTTWCKKVISTWVNACEEESQVVAVNASVTETNQTKNNTNGSNGRANEDEDEQCLRQFDLLVYIALRQQAKHLDIIDMIKAHPVVTEYSLQFVIDDLLRTEPHVCLILIDDLDEWIPEAEVNIPGRTGLHGCPVLTTSRPYRLVGINDTDDDFHSDRSVRITGIRDKELLVRKIILQLNNTLKGDLLSKDKLYESSQKDYSKFIEDVKSMKDRDVSYHKILPGYMNIPLMLIIMVCLWFDKKKFENTLTRNMTSMIEFIIRYAERFSRGVFKRKKATVGKLEGISNLHELKEVWSKFANILPWYLSEYTTLRGYSELIFKVSYLAYQSLFNSKHQIQLIFSQDDLIQYFNEEELRVIVKIGFLSQSEVTESPLCPMTKLSFIHKAFHEYFAGVYVTIQLNLGKFEKVEMLKQFFSDPVVCNLPDIDNVPLFVGGFDPLTASKMSKFLFQGLTRDIYIINVKYFNGLLLRQVQVIHENYEKYPSEKYPIYTEFIYVPNDLVAVKMKYLLILFNTNIKHLKHAEIPCKMAVEVLEKINSDQLQDDFSLRIYDITHSVPCDSLARALLHVPKLQKLALHGLGTYSESVSERCTVELPECVRLTHLSLKDLSNMTIIAKPPIQTLERDNADDCEVRFSEGFNL